MLGHKNLIRARQIKPDMKLRKAFQPVHRITRRILRGPSGQQFIHMRTH